MHRLVTFSCVLWLVACDWVDSAGSTSSNQLPDVTVSADALVVTPMDDATGSADAGAVPADDAPAETAGPLTLALTEEATTRLVAEGTDADGRVTGFRWSEAPVDEGSIEACQAVDGFDPARAGDSLAAACSVADCAPVFDVQPVGDTAPAVDDTADADAADVPADADDAAAADSAADASGTATFDVTLPALRAPIGLTYELTATDDRGGERATPVTFCAVSINEAPEAVDDSFSVLEGSVLDVDADVLNLLSNDSDDIDSSNEPLQVLTEPVRPPIAADVFELREDGGFTYAFTGTSLTSDIVDSFDYAITDGTFTSMATATIRIVQRDDPPELVRQLPAFEAVEGLPFDVDLAPYFDDPEGADLGFDVLAGDLPPSGDIALSPIGVLAGTAAEADAGDYAFTVAASDGTLAAEADVALTVFDNEPVVATAIPARRVRVNRRIRFGIARYFTDPESVSLAFRLTAASNASLNLTIDTSSGIITGFATEPGRYELTVTASDGFNRRWLVRSTWLLQNDDPVARPSVGRDDQMPPIALTDCPDRLPRQIAQTNGPTALPTLTPYLLVKHSEGWNVDRVCRYMERTGQPYQWCYPAAGQDLPDPAGHAGVVVFGGAESANDCREHEWVREELRFIERCLRAQTPLFGICLGAQMLARVLGARVEPHPDGLDEIGFHTVEPTPPATTSCPPRWP